MWSMAAQSATATWTDAHAPEAKADVLPATSPRSSPPTCLSHDIVDSCLGTSWTPSEEGVAMGLERYVVDAVVLEGRSPTEIARSS